MSSVLLWLCGLSIVVLGVLFANGRRHVLQGMDWSWPSREWSNPPAVAMSIPLTGNSPEMRKALATLLDQDYPALRYVFVTKDETDPATALVAELIAGRDDAELIHSGPATTCGQKNHNQLAAVAHLGTWPEIFVFCDSTHDAPRYLVSCLVAPIVEGKAVLTSGYHRIIPRDFSVATMGMLFSTLAIHLLQSFRFLSQPWGGAMAVTRRVFEEHDVAQVWSTNIVDDFSMGPHLLKKGIRCLGVADAALKTSFSSKGMKAWDDWLTRQLFYLKFCTPVEWVLGIFLVVAFSGPVVLSLLCLFAGMFGVASTGTVDAALVSLVSTASIGAIYRVLAPVPIPMFRWLLGFYTILIMVGWCYLRTWTTNIMAWRGIAYRVGFGGVVKEIFHTSPRE
ncbi:glycosyltransferase [Desulfovibrio inopinatus]|uniref:glycosyltransferase n=1 Tax=Desulfovibrio inopinatus TaxID=102109 RepID=UPI000408CC89|nr:glycosyltransferase [Desulfovibrio inopinatus]